MSFCLEAYIQNCFRNHMRRIRNNLILNILLYKLLIYPKCKHQLSTLKFQNYC